MILPNFLILGAAKAGTTALYHYLRQHPQVFMTPIKETNYFALKDEPLDFRGPGDPESISRFSVTTRDGYQAQFAGSEGAVAIGEASPLYLYDPRVAARLKEAVPGAKLVVILRDPVARAFSAFLHLVRDGRETTDDFAEALLLEDRRVADRWEHIWHYKRMGLYHEQLARYFALFDRDQIRIYIYRDFRERQAEVLGDLFRFVGVDDGFRPDTTSRHNVSDVPEGRRPSIAPETRAELQSFFRDDVARLQDLIGQDLARWLDG